MVHVDDVIKQETKGERSWEHIENVWCNTHGIYGYVDWCNKVEQHNRRLCMELKWDQRL